MSKFASKGVYKILDDRHQRVFGEAATLAGAKRAAEDLNGRTVRSSKWKWEEYRGWRYWNNEDSDYAVGLEVK